MIFFTDLQTKASNYCLLNINRYDSKQKPTKKICFVDPGVTSTYFKTHGEFEAIEKLHYLAQGHLLENEYLTIDYPGDMIPKNLPPEEYKQWTETYIKKSLENNWRYKDNPQYICTIQYKFRDYKDFVFRMQELEPIYANKKKIVGLGNLCRFLKPNKYFDKVIEYIIANRTKFYWIHIYGMSKGCMRKYLPLLQIYAPNIIISADNTKWTCASTKKLNRKYKKHPDQHQLFPTKHRTLGYCCNNDTRDEFFIDNIEDLKKRGIKIEY